jgi:DNA-binding NarL/FixJ family response regulator
VRVVLADDAVLVREGVARLLAEAGFDVVGQSATAEELLREVDAQAPDVAIVDIRMPPTRTDEGLRAALQIRRGHPEVGVLVLSQHVDAAVAMRLLDESAEGVGYMLKERVGDLEELSEAVRRIGHGGSVLDAAIVAQLVGGRRCEDPLEALTAREREVLELMAEGCSIQGIADRLVITLRAVEKYVSSVFTKLGLPSTGSESRRVLAVLLYLRA